MRRVEKFARYCGTMFALLFIVLIGNLLLLGLLNFWSDSYQAYVSVGSIAKQLVGDAEEGYTMPEETIWRLEWYEAFAFLIGEDGEVLWEYHMPEELPREYSRKDVAAFSRWYLRDYPVYTHLLDDGIFVVGKQKGTVWRYTWIENTDTMEAYMRYLPGILFVDVLLVTVLPFWLVRRQATKGERERTTWIAGVSHDIRTPLSLILGAASGLKEVTDEAMAQKVELIEEQTLRIRNLIANLNTENKLSYGMGKWEREEIILSAFLREVMCDVLNRQPGEQYIIVTEIEKELEQCVLRADRSLVRRLLENLINNSVVHNPNGCYITVRLATSNHWTKMAVLTVEDDGVGVSEARLKALRKPVRMDKLSEHGLGLRVVRQIAALYHWPIRFEHSEGEGFRCQISIKVSREA